MASDEWKTIVGGAAEGALSSWLDQPNDQSMSASDEAVMADGQVYPERKATKRSSSDANTGNTGWTMPGSSQQWILVGGAVVAVIALATLAAQ
jgi:hypothetical protein